MFLTLLSTGVTNSVSVFQSKPCDEPTENVGFCCVTHDSTITTKKSGPNWARRAENVAHGNNNVI